VGAEKKKSVSSCGLFRRENLWKELRENGGGRFENGSCESPLLQPIKHKQVKKLKKKKKRNGKGGGGRKSTVLDSEPPAKIKKLWP